MANFKTAYEYLKKFDEDRAGKIEGVERTTWAVDEFDKLADLEELFNTDELNEKWYDLYSAKKPAERDIGLKMGLRNQIAWMAGCRRDLRKQFMAGDDSRQRVANDHTRYELIRLYWAAKGLQRMFELLDKRATTPLVRKG